MNTHTHTQLLGRTSKVTAEKSNCFSYNQEFKTTKDKTWLSIQSLKSERTTQSPGRKINQSSNGFRANLSFLLFVSKSIEYRKQQYISSGRSDPKYRKEKDTPSGDHYLKWPFSEHSFQLWGYGRFLKTVIKPKGQCFWMGYSRRSTGKANSAD